MYCNFGLWRQRERERGCEGGCEGRREGRGAGGRGRKVVMCKGNLSNNKPTLRDQLLHVQHIEFHG